MSKKFVWLAGSICLLAMIMIGCGNGEDNTGGEITGENGSGTNDESEENSVELSEEEISNYPEEELEMVIPYSPGGATDVIFRVFASYAEEHLGQEIVPVNMEGATSTNGSQEVRKSDPDGYTFLASHDVIATANIQGVVDYSFDAFEPVSLLTETPNMAVINSENEYETLGEFVDYVNNNPGEVSWGYTPGSTSHYFITMMMDEAGIESDALNLVSYEGTGDAIQAVTANEIQGTMGNVPSAGEQIEEGSFTALGIASEERLDAYPDIPTFIEEDIDMTHSTSRGVFLPKGTPDEIVHSLSEAFGEAANDPELVQEIVEDLGSIVRHIPSEEYSDFVEEKEQELIELSESMELE
ncbi:tripartite tricarboxylate transporter substrate binding protein [Salibacterium aidingense]|uniref:tripartite tricarboxylate transporter substrate binding protein n=1 Tax=Salibacterium aidingense TaxID=384933 RepID=UPI00040774C1|nr:tripartite tricarboxylate transporter substrate binding protein [Salibacterium aidingense]